MEHLESREMKITRTVKAPIDIIWNVWTDPEHIVHWWGPDGFTSTIRKMDVREGGEWILTLHGPDGTNYPNRSIYMEIVSLEKIVFEHFNPHFFATILFEDKGEDTGIKWTMLFDTVEIRKTVVKVHKADDGLRQNVDRLEEYLSKL